MNVENPENIFMSEPKGIYLGGADGKSRRVLKAYRGNASGKAELWYEYNNSSFNPFTDISYTSTSIEIVDEGAGNWKAYLKASGTITFANPTNIDVFLVGGGGSGGKGKGDGSSSGGGGGGGGGGYCLTVPSVAISGGQSVAVTVGAGGVNTYTNSTHRDGYPTYFGDYFAEGGARGEDTGYRGGGRGGSGGGGGAVYNKNGEGNGGTAGADGKKATDGGGGGYGQKSGSNTAAIRNKYLQLPTREFYAIDQNTSATAYAAGGKGGNGRTGANGTAGTANTGNGGTGAGVSYQTTNRNGGRGGSGIVIIRNAR